MNTNPGDAPESNDSDRGVAVLKKVFSKYDIPPRNLSLLTLHLYEVFDGCRQYIENYEALFTLPKSQVEEQEQLLDVLAGVDVLLEDIQHHAKELKEQIKDFVDAVEPEDEPDS